MSLIQLLPDNIANQIAAGEVIQRPASVVKELVENAIDACATKIDVVIKDAGKTLIQVVDNGSGMNADDAKLCFERHATSKVRVAEDLFALSTKGFRGEALASIAAIAHVTMKTKLSASDTGTHITIEGSKITNEEQCVCSNGTRFDVKNLFYNVPARRNFLKSDQVEMRHIVDEFERVALAHPSIEFTLTSNGKELYNLPAVVLRKRVVDILGKKSNDRLVPIEESTDIVKIKGFVLKPEHARKTRGEQFFFVNDRFFKSTYFNNAINRAFEGLIKDKAYPSYFLYLWVDPDKIDVNVHPTKTEIKFEEDKFIYSILYSSIKQALGKYNISPTLDFERETSFDVPLEIRKQPAVEPKIDVDPTYNPFVSTSKSSGTGVRSSSSNKALNSQGFGNQQAAQSDWENFYEIKEEEPEIEPAEIEFENLDQKKSAIVKGSYILTPSKSGFLVIHAKRAYQQIVYENISKSFISNPLESQKLLFPITLEIGKSEQIAWEANSSLLNQLGFEGVCQEGNLELTAVPNVLEENGMTQTIEELLEILVHTDLEKSDIANSLISSLSLAASKRNIDTSNDVQIQSLIDQLFACENHTYTSNNLKIIEQLSLEEIAQKLK